MTKLFNWRVYLVFIVLFFSIIAINPNPFAKGVEIKSVEQGSVDFENDVKSGEIVKSINGVEIKDLNDYNTEISKLEISEKEISVLTDKGLKNYNVSENIGFVVDENLTIMSSEFLDKDSKILEINNKKIENINDLNNITGSLFPKKRFVLTTDKGEYAYLISGEPRIKVETAKGTNLKLGLDLQGGTRILLKPESEKGVSDQQISDLIKILDNRLNVYGLADLKIRSASDWSGNKFVLIEVAGISREDVKELMAKQGVFEAKIDKEVVFIGGKGDIPFVCREDGTCSGVRDCGKADQNQWNCRFEFQISLSDSAAKKHAEVTNKLDINISEGGKRILSRNLDLYLDDRLVDSLQISADLKGQEATDILISGPGFGKTELEAYNDALNNMDKLQTVLITGSLPLKLSIVKLDTISPIIGKEFVKNSFLVGIMAIIAVGSVIFIKYRRIKIIIPIMITSISEIIITLGVAAMIQWNLDLAAIAGIIAAVGTGVDDQIVITDELLRGEEEKYLNLKERIKKAFFIVFAAYATTFVAMIPLLNAGAGLLRGFAVTTIIGITIGVFLTRRAFASVIERIVKG